MIVPNGRDPDAQPFQISSLALVSRRDYLAQALAKRAVCVRVKPYSKFPWGGDKQMLPVSSEDLEIQGGTNWGLWAAGVGEELLGGALVVAGAGNPLTDALGVSLLANGFTTAVDANY